MDAGALRANQYYFDFVITGGSGVCDGIESGMCNDGRLPYPVETLLAL
jgi:hypothetical protein